MKALLLRSITVAVGIVMGCAAGGYLAFHRYARDYAMIRAFAWSGVFAAVSEGQYDKESSDAKQGLLYTLDYYSQGLQSSKVDPIMKKALRMNCGLIEARLSVLENEAGNTNQASVYMSKAQEDLKSVGWVDPSEANILQAVKRQPASPCGTASQSEAKAVTSTPPKACR